jgi:excisionase family DNA binding protein
MRGTSLAMAETPGRPARRRGYAAIPFAQRLACTIAEACEATGLGRTKLYELISAGCIGTTTVGRRRLVLVSSLTADALINRAPGKPLVTCDPAPRSSAHVIESVRHRRRCYGSVGAGGAVDLAGIAHAEAALNRTPSPPGSGPVTSSHRMTTPVAPALQ